MKFLAYAQRHAFFSTDLKISLKIATESGTSPELNIPETNVIGIITEHCHSNSRRTGPKRSQHQQSTNHVRRSLHNHLQALRLQDKIVINQLQSATLESCAAILAKSP